MLFHVEMTVSLPVSLDETSKRSLLDREKARALELQRAGTWRHLWRIAGRYANISIFDVETPEQLHEVLSGLPLFPYMDIKVQALCRHPSSVHGDDR